MVRESTMVCVDNSDYMRNGDFVPTRFQAQQDAVNLVCHSKTRTNPENNVGLLKLANVEVLATLTSDVGRILSKLHKLHPNGNISLLTGIKIAHLALKHRQSKENKMRIVVFVGSPVVAEENELVNLAKRLKKEKVNVDVVSFGEDASNNEILTAFINTLNGRDGSGSHLVTIPPGSDLSDALISSPVIQGEDGLGVAGIGPSGFEFGVDPNEDPELALALRVSMEEQRHRQEQEARRSTRDDKSTRPETIKEIPSEETLLERALAMSMEVQEESTTPTSNVGHPDFTEMTEEEQISFALRMSMQDSHVASSVSPSVSAPANDNAGVISSETVKKDEDKEETPMEVEDYAEVMNDPVFLQSVLENLPGVDPQSEAVRQAVTSLSKDNEKDDIKQNKDQEKK